MDIESKCRRLCHDLGQDPDAVAPKVYQDLPGYPEHPVRVWEVWRTTVVARLKRKGDQDRFEKEKKACREYLNRVIAETSRGQEAKYKFHTAKF